MPGDSPGAEELILFLNSTASKSRDLFSAEELEVLEETITLLKELKSIPKEDKESRWKIASKVISNCLPIFTGEDPFGVLGEFYLDLN